MTGEQILRLKPGQTPSAFQLVGIIVPGPMAVQLLLTLERQNADVANEPNLNPVGVFDVIVQLVVTFEVRRTIAAA